MFECFISSSLQSIPVSFAQFMSFFFVFGYVIVYDRNVSIDLYKHCLYVTVGAELIGLTALIPINFMSELVVFGCVCNKSPKS